MRTPHRQVMHAAVAAGGAAAALMSAAALAGTEAEVRTTALVTIDPLLRAVTLAIDAAGHLSGCADRRRLQVAIEDYLGARGATAPEAVAS